MPATSPAACWTWPAASRSEPGAQGPCPVDASEDLTDLSADGIDLAIRYGLQRQDGTQLLADGDCAAAAAAICPNGTPVVEEVAGRPLPAYRWRNATLEGPNWAP